MKPPKSLDNRSDQDACNRNLLRQLADDQERKQLFEQINRGRGRLPFPSRDSARRSSADAQGPLDMPPAPMMGHRDSAMIVTDRKEIEQILKDDGTQYSSRVYAELGGGNFMLSLDPGASKEANDTHAAQRAAFRACFPESREIIAELADAACEAATIVSLRPPTFDLALFAEQAALRFCQKLLGYSMRDHRLLESALRAGYAGLVYQVFGRHFKTDPTALPRARNEMGILLKRTSELIDAYADDDPDADALKGTDDHTLPFGFVPVLKGLARHPGDLNGEQRAILAMGAALGTVGNVQAAVCIAIKAFFDDPEGRYRKARALARSHEESSRGSTRKFDEWRKLIAAPLRDNPPIPYLPRVKLDDNKNPVRELLLALGAATYKCGAAQGGARKCNENCQAIGGDFSNCKAHDDDPLIWGLPKEANHWCAGQSLAWPLIVEIVRHVMRLPGLAEQLDPADGTVIGLKKRWGFACESYPLSYHRDQRVAQSSLNVAMRLRAPVKESADRVREVLRAGAPRIEELLRESKHVHFAWFELIESDTVLVLHTVYDGPFAPYVNHFAQRAGDLFDALFEWIESPPPMPVSKFPNEFVAHIQRFDRGPVLGFFFSAYPKREVAHITREQAG